MKGEAAAEGEAEGEGEAEAEAEAEGQGEGEGVGEGSGSVRVRVSVGLGFEPAMANICEVPDQRMSSSGILRPEPPRQSTPIAPMAALIPRSHTSARKVYLKYSPPAVPR